MNIGFTGVGDDETVDDSLRDRLRQRVSEIKLGLHRGRLWIVIRLACDIGKDGLDECPIRCGGGANNIRGPSIDQLVQLGSSTLLIRSVIYLEAWVSYLL